MKRKIISIICSVLVFAAMLSFIGCGGSGGSDSGSSGATISGSGN